jgi:hypothetical protein
MVRRAHGSCAPNNIHLHIICLKINFVPPFFLPNTVVKIYGSFLTGLCEVGEIFVILVRISNLAVWKKFGTESVRMNGTCEVRVHCMTATTRSGGCGWSFLLSSF